MKYLVALTSGVLFGFGLSLSRMVDPEKVLGFLDIAGDWDPSLAFVMMGALTVAILSFRIIFQRSRPVLESGFHVSRRTQIDKPLLIGAAIFGIGWGLSGYCPGPAVAAIGLQTFEAVLMVMGIYSGFFAHKLLLKTASGEGHQRKKST